MTPEKEIRNAERARQIINDEVFREAVEKVEDALLAGIRRSAFADEKLREKLCARYALLHDLLGCLQSTMETGVLAEMEKARPSGVVDTVAHFIGDLPWRKTS